jgi:hypothetical protein
VDGFNASTPVRTGPMGHFRVPRDEETANEQEGDDADSSFQSPDAHLSADEESESLIASVMLISHEPGRDFSSNPTTSLGHSNDGHSPSIPQPTAHHRGESSSSRVSLSGPPQTAYPDTYYNLPPPSIIQNPSSNTSLQPQVRRIPAHRRKSSNLANEYLPGVSGSGGPKLQTPVYSHSRTGSASAPDLRVSSLRPNRWSISPIPDNETRLPPLAPNRYVSSVPPEDVTPAPQSNHHRLHQLQLQTTPPPPPPPSSYQPHSGTETTSPYSAATTTEGSLPSGIDPTIIAMYPGRAFTNTSDVHRAQSLESSIVEPHFDEVRLRNATMPPNRL